MKKLATYVVAAAALIGTPAFAADMPVKAPPPAPAPIYNWTGWYVGGNVGGGWGNRNVSYAPNDVNALISAGQGIAPPPSASFNTSGVLGGLQLGYNYQISSIWVVGLETDFDWSDVKGSGSSSGTHAATIPFTLPVNEKIDWFGTVRGRLGYLPTPNLLAYVTGGFAYGRVGHSGSWINNSSIGAFILNAGPGSLSTSCGPGTCWAGSSNSVATGWTLGGGLEYALWQQWTVRAEYLYVSLESKSITETALMTIPGFPTPSSFNGNFSRTNFNVVRVGLNYQFH
jgi:outer membrane immunogenic protein